MQYTNFFGIWPHIFATIFQHVLKAANKIGEYIVFAEYMIYSETCGLEIDPLDNNRYRFFVYRGNVDDKLPGYVADSITAFIQLFINEGVQAFGGVASIKNIMVGVTLATFALNFSRL